MKALSIDFCGIHCENPFFLSSSCVAGNAEMCARALEAGWGGIVYKTVGHYIPKEVSPRYDMIRQSRAFVGLRNMEQISDRPLEDNLRDMAFLKKKFPNKILIASIMGETIDDWESLARLVEEAGADIIECNFSCPQMAQEAMGADVGVNPDMVREACRSCRNGTSLPILAKMTPNITDMTIPAIAAIEGGADGLAAINTIKSITNIHQGKILPDISGKSCVSGYSGRAIKPIALRFISDMAKCVQLKNVPISGIGGITTWQDALEFILLGSTNLQITTAVMEYGYRIIEDLTDGLLRYMDAMDIPSLQSLVGAALPDLTTSDKLDRNTVVYPAVDYDGCVGCGRCYISCMDGGHQAIAWLAEQRKPQILRERCVGCGLCSNICPVEAIGSTSRISKGA